MSSPETEGTSRRTVLRTAVNVGVGAGLVWGLGADYATTDQTVEIEYALVRSPPDGTDLVPRTKTVPGDWYASTKAAFEVQETLRDAPLSSLVGSFVVPGSFDDPSASLAVDATGESVANDIREVVADVDVNVSVLGDLPPKPDGETASSAPFQLSDVDRRSVPGGIHCRGPEINGTLASAAFDRETGDRYFVTSNHVFGAQGTKETEHRGQPLAVAADGDDRVVGRVERGYPAADVVRVAPASDAVPAPEIRRAVPDAVVGQFTRMGLAELHARGEQLQKFGAFSGHTAGSIRGVDGITCYLGEVCKAGQLKWGSEAAITDGDSGSINYHPDPEHPDDYVIAGGINNARSWWPGADFTWGTAGFHLLEEYGLHF